MPHIFQCSLNIYKHYQYIRSDQKGNLKFQEKLVWVMVVTTMLLYWPREVPSFSWPPKPQQTPRTRNVESNWWEVQIHKAYLLTLKVQCGYRESEGHQEMDSLSLLVWWVCYRKHTDWNCPPWLGTIVMSAWITTGSPDKEYGTNKPPPAGRVRKGPKETPRVHPLPRIPLASILLGQAMRAPPGKTLN